MEFELSQTFSFGLFDPYGMVKLLLRNKLKQLMQPSVHVQEPLRVPGYNALKFKRSIITR